MTPRALFLSGAVVFTMAMVLGMTRTEETAVAGPFVAGQVTTRTYDVSGPDLATVERQMNRQGPFGHWAYARTSWDWDDACNVTFKARITLPKLVNRHRLDAAELAEWDRMIAVLTEHEMNHVRIGQGWATAIKRAGCDPAAIKRINREWRGKDGAYDRRTGHGRTEGVYLTKP
ncbi:MAG: DUF922 domain-containing protein [Rhodobacter sp.]|nr:DUF922 domain-containing protein [Rhodobacter sp.]